TFAGSGSSLFTDGTGTAAAFNRPYAVAVDPNGNLYVADTNNDLIRKITSGGVTSTILGRPVGPGNVHGDSSSAPLSFPQATRVDPHGHLIISDTFNPAIRVASLAAPRIVNFSANPLAVKRGASTTLSWSTTDATSVSISPGLGSVQTSGSLPVTLQQTTTF